MFQNLFNDKLATLNDEQTNSNDTIWCILLEHRNQHFQKTFLISSVPCKVWTIDMNVFLVTDDIISALDVFLSISSEQEE